MGAHKGRKWKDKPSVIRYWNSNRRRQHKIRNIRRNNGAKFLARWEKEHPA